MNDENRGGLNDIAKRLGERAAERLDVQATARRVVERLRAGEQGEEPRRPSWRQAAWLRIAAAIVLLVGGVFLVKQLSTDELDIGHQGVAAHIVADDLADLTTAQLQEVLKDFDQLMDSTVSPEDSTGTEYEELDAQQLQTVLRSLEG